MNTDFWNWAAHRVATLTLCIEWLQQTHIRYKMEKVFAPAI